MHDPKSKVFIRGEAGGTRPPHSEFSGSAPNGDQHSADISTDPWPICWPRLGRVSVDTLFELIDRRSTLSVNMSVDTRPIPRPIYVAIDSR